MLAKQRRNTIMDILRVKGTIKITEIVEQLSVSNETARRDLEMLQSENLVKRVHGGAVLLESQNSKSIYRLHRNTGYAEKQAIGKLAASLVKEGDTIMLGNGSTILEVARNLKYYKNLTVLTISLPVIMELTNPDIKLIALGGMIDPNEYCMYGSLTYQAMEHFFVDKLFIGAGGITLDGGVTDYGLDPIYRKVLFEHSNKTILVADSAKFGNNAFSYFCSLDDVDTVVTDKFLDADFSKGIMERNIELLLAGSSAGGSNEKLEE